MLLIKYIREHFVFHIIVITVYALYFLAFVLSVSEVFCNYGYNDYSVEETTYSFQIYDLNMDSMRQLTSSSVTLAAEDISLCVKKDDYAMVAFLTSLSDRRGADDNQLVIDSHEFISDSGLSTSEYLTASSFTEKTGYSHVGTIDISYWIEESPNVFFYCSVDDICDFIDKDSEIFVSFLFEEPINNEKLSLLKDIVFDSMGLTRYVVHTENTNELSLFSTGDLKLIIGFGVLCCCCFSRLILALIENREKEYQIMYFCGATETQIDMQVFMHLLLVLNLSAAIGLILFWSLRFWFPQIVIYQRDSWIFYISSYLVYLFTGLLTAWSLMIIRRKKYGYFFGIGQ